MKIYKYILLLVFLLSGNQFVVGQETPQEMQCEGTKKIKGETWTEIPDGLNPSTRVDPPVGGPENTDERFIFWVHGDGGDEGSWQRAGAATQDFVTLPTGMFYPPRKVQSKYMDLASFNQSLNVSGSVLKGDVRDETLLQTEEEKERNIIVAHSLGGLVSRFADKFQHDDEEKYFGGLVTFGSAHQGAQIINNMPIMLNFISESCEELGIGFVTEQGIAAGNAVEDFVDSKPLLDLFINENNIADAILNVSQLTVSAFCEQLDVIALQTVLADFENPIAAEYAVGSPILNEINDYVSDTYKVAFYSEEPGDEVFWTTFYYLINDPITADFFSAENDQRGVEIAQTNTLRYQAKRDAYEFLQEVLEQTGGQTNFSVESLPASMQQELEDNCGIIVVSPPGGPSPTITLQQFCNCVNAPYADLFPDPNEGAILEDLCTNDIDDAEALVEAWDIGLNWWLTANDRYKAAIGAAEVIMVGTDECECATQAPNGTWSAFYPVTGNGDCVSDFANGIWCQAILEPAYTSKPSDGIVLTESAGGLPINDDLREKRFKIEGSSHRQIRNDENLRQRLLMLWDGGTDIDFFVTEEK